MAEYDGSIRINTKIDTANLPSQMQKIINSIKKAEGEVERLRAKMDALKNQKIPTQDYAQLQAELRKAEARADSLYGKLRVMEKSGVDRTSASYARLREQIAQADRYIDELRADMQDMESSGKAFTLGGDSEEYAKMATRVEELTASIEASNQRLSEMQGKQIPISDGFSIIKQKATAAFGVLANAHPMLKAAAIGFLTLKKAADTTYDFIKKGAQKAFGAIKSTVSGIVKNAGNIFDAIKTKVASAFESIKKNTKKSSGLFSTFASRLKGITLSLLIFNWITKSFNAMVSGMKTGFENLMGYSAGFANSVQSLKNSMATLGNQFAAAFAPIVQMVIPWLRSLINAISTAMSYVAQFIALLGGKSTFTRAKQIQDSYNKSLDKTASSAKKAAGALAKFDDLDVLQKKEDDAAGAGAGVTQPEDMFEEVPVDPKLFDLFDWLKDMWDNANFYELGKKLGEKLLEALRSIPWDAIKEQARKIGQSIATFINGFIEVEGLGYEIGKTLSEAFNTAFEFLYSFVRTLNWDSLGKFIADTINGFFENIDLGLIRRTLVTLALGLSDLLDNFVKNINVDAITTAISSLVNTIVQSFRVFLVTADWKALGETIGNLISGTIEKIGWKNIGTTLSFLAQSLLELFISAIQSVDWSEIGTAIQELLNGIHWQELGVLVGNGAISAFTSIKEIITNIDWASIGSDIATFLNGVDWANVSDALFGALVSAIKSVFSLLQGFISTLDWTEIGRAFGDGINTIITGIKEAVLSIDPNELGQSISDFINGAIEAFSASDAVDSINAVITWLGTVFDTAISTIDWMTIFQKMQTVLSGIDWYGILRPVLELFAAQFTFEKIFKVDLLQQIGKSIIEGIKDGIAEKIGGIAEWLYEHIIKPITDAIYGFFGMTGPDVSSETFKSVGKMLMQGLIDGLSSLNPVTSIINIAKKIKDAFTTETEINSPSRTFEGYGQYIVEGLNNGIASTDSTSIVSAWIESIKALFTPEMWYETFAGIGTSFQTVWNEIQTWFSEYWAIFTENLSVVWENIVLFFTETWANIQLIFQTFIDFLSSIFAPIWETIWTTAQTILQNFQTFIDTVCNTVKNIITTFFTIVKQLINGEWKGAWETAKQVFETFKGKVDSIISAVRGILDSFFGWVMEMVSGVLSAISSIGTAISGAASSFGNFVSGIGGKIGGFLGISTYSAGIDTPAFHVPQATIDNFNIPHLASGSVIQGGRPFPAILGDQPRGQVNIEAPLNTIRQAVREELSGMQYGGGISPVISLNIDGSEFARLTLNDILSEAARQGYDVSVWGVT